MIVMMIDALVTIRMTTHVMLIIGQAMLTDGGGGIARRTRKLGGGEGMILIRIV
jgi:hypothetical protein